MHQSVLKKFASLLLKLDKRLVKNQFPRLRHAINAEEVCSTEVVFLISPGRSGTKSIVQFCSKYTDIYCEHAATPWLSTTGYLYHQNKFSSESARQAYYSSREPYLIRAYEAKKSFLDGDCKNLPLLPEIARLLPNAKFIHVVRQPKSFISSGITRGYYKQKPAELWGHLEPKPAIKNTLSQTEKIAFFWNEANQIAEKMKQDLGPNKVTTLIAEQVFGQPSLIFDALDKLSVSYKKNHYLNYEIEHLNKQNKMPLESNDNSDLLTTIEQHCPTRLIYYPQANVENLKK